MGLSRAKASMYLIPLHHTHIPSLQPFKGSTPEILPSLYGSFNTYA